MTKNHKKIKYICNFILFLQILNISTLLIYNQNKSSSILLLLPIIILSLSYIITLCDKKSNLIIFLYIFSSIWISLYSLSQIFKFSLNYYIYYSILFVLMLFFILLKNKRLYIKEIIFTLISLTISILLDVLIIFIVFFLFVVFICITKKEFDILKFICNSFKKSFLSQIYFLLFIFSILSYAFQYINISVYMLAMIIIVAELDILIKIKPYLEDNLNTDLIQIINLQNIKNSSKQNLMLSEYLHDEILQSILYVRRKIYDVKNSNNFDITTTKEHELENSLTMLDYIISSIRNEMDFISPNISPDISLKRNYQLAIKKIKNMYNKDILLEFYCSENLYLQNPYDEILYKIIKELSNNIYKHTNSTFAEIRIELIGNILFINSRNDDGEIKSFNEIMKSNKGLGFINKTVSSLNGDMSIRNLSTGGISIDIKFEIKGVGFFENIIDR